MLEIFQSAPTHEFRNQPASLDFVQTIENIGLLETLGFQREPHFPHPGKARVFPSAGRNDSDG
jgi:hypothetical protein